MPAWTCIAAISTSRIMSSSGRRSPMRSCPASRDRLLGRSGAAGSAGHAQRVGRWPKRRHGLPSGGSNHQPGLASRSCGAGRACLGRRRADVVFRPARPSFSALDLRARRRPRQVDGDHLQGGRQRQGRRRLLEHQLSAADLSLVAPLCAACRDDRLLGLRFPSRGLPRDRGLGGAGPDRAHGPSDLLALVEAMSDALRPPAAAAGMGLWRRDHRPEGWSRLLRAARRHHRGRNEGVGPVVRGLGRPSPHLVRRAPVLGLEGERGALSGPAPADRRTADRGIRFLGYVNPYLAVDGSLFPEAEAAGLLRKGRAARRLSSISASSIAASSISPIRMPPLGSPSG